MDNTEYLTWLTWASGLLGLLGQTKFSYVLKPRNIKKNLASNLGSLETPISP